VQGFTQLMTLFILSLIPLFEGRYAIVLVLTDVIEVDIFAAYVSVVIATMLLAMTLVLLMRYLDMFFTWCGSSKTWLLKLLGNLYAKYVLSIRKRSKRYVDRFGVLALSIFVAVPIPATGIWSGALVAYIFGFDRVKAFIALFLGGLASIAITSVAAIFFDVILT